MSSTAEKDRVNELLAKADELIKANNLQGAAEALKEASRLDGQNAKVKERWLALQKREDGQTDVVDQLRTYISSQDAAGGQRVLQALKLKPLPQKDAVEATELLLHARSRPELLDNLTATLLLRNVESRKHVAAELAANATATFELAFEAGEETFNVFTSITLEAFAWPSQAQQATAQRDVFRLCVATLIEAGAEHLERVMKCIGRLLTLAPENVASIVDADVVDAMLSSLDIRLQASLRSQAMLAATKLLEATKDKGEELFSEFITQRAAKQTNDDLIIVFSAAAALFPVVTAVAAKLFLTDGFVQQLVPNLERNSEDGHAGGRKSRSLERSALELLSAACVDGACREAIKRYCSSWLENLTEEREDTHKALAAVVLAKINADSAADVTAKLEEMILSDDSESDQAIEGLAYTSLRGISKEEIASNEKLIKRLVKVVKEKPGVMFGCLTIFTNLTAYRQSQSEEQKKMSQLKAYANSSKPAPEDPLDDAEHVTARCRKVLDAEIVPALIACCKQTVSPTNVALITSILLNLAREQTHRSKMAQEGAVRLLLQIRERASKTEKASTEASTISRDAAHALARLLISLNPDHIFTSALPASNAVSALATLLAFDRDNEQRNLLAPFEALLALTNLASMEDNSIRDLQVRLVWSPLEDHLLFSSNVLVQRAAVELVCNLMASPACVAKFVGDGSKREGARIQIILALADAEDLATRRAAGGALAMLTEWDAAVTAVLDHGDKGSGEGPDGVKVLLKMCADESEEVRHRGFVCVANVVGAPGDVGKRGTVRVKEKEGVKVFQDALKGSKDREVVGIGVEVLKKLM